MNFKILGLENELPLNSGVNCLLIQNKSFYKKFVYQLLNGEGEEDFGLVDEDGMFLEDVFKYVDFIQNPYCLNLDDKKLVNAFYKELSLQIISDDELYGEIRTKIGEVQNLLQNLEADLDFELETNENITDILKYFNVSLKKQGASMLENLYQYIDIYSRWFKNNKLMFLNCLSILTNNEIIELDKYAKYHNMALIFIEMQDFEKAGINCLTIYEDFSDSLALNDSYMI